jgi:hypothetical protein
LNFTILFIAWFLVPRASSLPDRRRDIKPLEVSQIEPFQRPFLEKENHGLPTT